MNLLRECRDGAMGYRLKTVVVFIAGLVLAGCALAVGPVQSPGTSPSVAEPDPDVARYLEMKEQEFRENEAALRAMGMARDVDSLQELVRSRRLFDEMPVLGSTPEQRAVVVDALETTAAHYLASVGITRDEATAATEAGLDVALSAARVVGGGAGFRDLVSVSEFVVAGSVKSVRAAPEGGSMSVRLVPASPESEAKVLTFPAWSTGTGITGKECVFFLSRSLARFRSERDGAATPPGGLLQQFEPYCLNDDGLYKSTWHGAGAVGAGQLRRLLEQKGQASRTR